MASLTEAPRVVPVYSWNWLAGAMQTQTQITLTDIKGVDHSGQVVGVRLRRRTEKGTTWTVSMRIPSGLVLKFSIRTRHLPYA